MLSELFMKYSFAKDTVLNSFTTRGTAFFPGKEISFWQIQLSESLSGQIGDNPGEKSPTLEDHRVPRTVPKQSREGFPFTVSSFGLRALGLRSVGAEGFRSLGAQELRDLRGVGQ